MIIISGRQSTLDRLSFSFVDVNYGKFSSNLSEIKMLANTINGYILTIKTQDIFRLETSKSYNNMDLPQKTYLGQRYNHNACRDHLLCLLFIYMEWWA